MKTYQARVENFSTVSQPDTYAWTSDGPPPLDFVISRDLDGTILSRYGDLKWDRTPYNNRSRPLNIYFDYWKLSGKTPANYTLDWQSRRSDVTPKRVELIRQLQWLVFVLIYLPAGKPLAPATLILKATALGAAARVAERNNVRISAVLVDRALLAECSPHCRVELIRIRETLDSLQPTIVEELIGEEKKYLAKLKNDSRGAMNRYGQTIPFPARIYSLILTNLSKELDAYEAVSDRVLALFNACAKDPFYAKEWEAQRKHFEKFGDVWDFVRPDFQAALKRFRLTEFWDTYGYPKTFLSLTTVIIDLYKISSAQMQAFTGMRVNEVQELPYNCLKRIYRSEADSYHDVISGRVTKLTSGLPKKVDWITSEKGRKAAELARRYSKAIYDAAGINTDDSGASASFPLFVSPWIGLRRNKKIAVSYIHAMGHRICERICPLIEEGDVRELSIIDFTRDWENEKKIVVGRIWPLARHQFRRSLALYAHASGVVSLTSLKRQLKHITREMSLFYAKGSQYAININASDDESPHFSVEWSHTRPLSEYIGYMTQVLTKDASELFGNHSHFVNMRLKDSQGELLVSRATTLKRFENGEMAYRETLIGGCTNIGACDKNPLDLFQVHCVANHCKNLVGNKGKLAKVLEAQTKLVERLESFSPASPELRHEKANLKVLLAVKQKVFEVNQN